MNTENNKKSLCKVLLSLLLGVVIGSFLHYSFYLNNHKEVASQKKIEAITKSVNKNTVVATTNTVAKHNGYLQKFKGCLSDQDYSNSLIIYKEIYDSAPETALELQNYLFEHLTTVSQDVKVLVLELYLGYFPNEVAFIVKLAEIYKKNKNFYQAISLYLQADIRDETWLNWSDKQIYQLAQQIYKTDTNIDTQLDLFSYLVQKYPSYSFYRFALAKLYLVLGYTEEAKSELFILTDSNLYGSKAKQLLNSIVSISEDDNSKTSSIPLFKYGNHFVVSAISSGIEMKLLIDTGTTFTVFTPRLLAEIKKKHGLTKIGKVNLLTANGEVAANLYRIKSFILGNYEITDLDVAEAATEIEGLDGLLGMNALSNYNFFIDQSDNMLSITPK